MLIALRMKGETAEEMIGAAHALVRGRAAVRAARLSVRRLLRHRRRWLGADQRLDRHGVRRRRRGLADRQAWQSQRQLALRLGRRARSARREDRRRAGRRARALLDETGFCFLFAPAYHPGMKHAALVRRQLSRADGDESARPVHQSRAAAGAAARRRRSEDAAPDCPDARRDRRRRSAGGPRLGARRGRAARRNARASGCRDGEIDELEITPEDAGLERAPLNVVTGGDAERECARGCAALLAGRGSARGSDIVVLNAAALLHTAGKAATLEGRRRPWRATRCVRARRARCSTAMSRRAVADRRRARARSPRRSATNSRRASTASRSTRCARERGRPRAASPTALAAARRPLHPRDQEGLAVGRRDPRAAPIRRRSRAAMPVSPTRSAC